MSSSVSRRDFFKIATGSIITIPNIVAGSVALVPQQALAEDFSTEEEAGSEEMLFTNEIELIPLKLSEVAFVVCDVSVGDPTKNRVAGAHVKVTSIETGESVEGDTDENGSVMFDIINLAICDEGQSRDDLKKYLFIGSVEITREDYRDFLTGKMIVEGLQTHVIPTRKLEKNWPYPARVTFDDWDVLYTDNTPAFSKKNDILHRLAVTVKNVSSDEEITLSLAETASGKVIQTMDDFPSGNEFSGGFSYHFLQEGNKEALAVETDYCMRLTQGEKTWQFPIRLKPVTPVFDAPKTLAPLKPLKPLGDPKAGKASAKLSKLIPIGGGSSLSSWIPDFGFVKVGVDPCGSATIAVTIGQIEYPWGKSLAWGDDGQMYQTQHSGSTSTTTDPTGHADVDTNQGWKSFPRKSIAEQWQKQKDAWKSGINSYQTARQHKNDPQSQGGKINFSKVLKLSLKLMVFGVVSWDVFDAETWDWNAQRNPGFSGNGGLALIGSCDFTYSNNFLAGPVPVLFQFGFKLSASVKATAGLSVADTDPKRDEKIKAGLPVKSWSDIMGDLDYWNWDFTNTGFSVTFTFSPWISLGVGVKGVASVSMRGSIVMTYYIGVSLPKKLLGKDRSNPHMIWSISAAIDLVFQLFFFTYSITVVDLSNKNFFNNWNNPQWQPEKWELGKVKLYGQSDDEAFLTAMADENVDVWGEVTNTFKGEQMDRMLTKMSPITDDMMMETVEAGTGLNAQAEATEPPRPVVTITYVEEASVTEDGCVIPAMVYTFETEQEYEARLAEEEREAKAKAKEQEAKNGVSVNQDGLKITSTVLPLTGESDADDDSVDAWQEDAPSADMDAASAGMDATSAGQQSEDVTVDDLDAPEDSLPEELVDQDADIQTDEIDVADTDIQTDEDAVEDSNTSIDEAAVEESDVQNDEAAVEEADVEPTDGEKEKEKDESHSDEDLKAQATSEVESPFAYTPRAYEQYWESPISGLTAMADAEPVIGIGDEGGIILSEAYDTRLNPVDKPVFGSQRMQVLPVGYRDGMISLRIGVVSINGKPRTRVIITKIAGGMNVGLTRVLEFDIARPIRQSNGKYISEKLEGYNRDDLYDYECAAVSTEPFYLHGHYLHLAVLSGRRDLGTGNNADELASCATDLVLTWLWVDIAAFAVNADWAKTKPLEVMQSFSWPGAMVFGEDKERPYHSISNLQINFDEALGNNRLVPSFTDTVIITYLDRSAAAPKDALSHQAGNARIRMGVIFCVFHSALHWQTERYYAEVYSPAAIEKTMGAIEDSSTNELRFWDRVDNEYVFMLRGSVQSRYHVMQIIPGALDPAEKYSDTRLPKIKAIRLAGAHDGTMCLHHWRDENGAQRFLGTRADGASAQAEGDPNDGGIDRELCLVSFTNTDSNNVGMEFQRIGPKDFSMSSFGAYGDFIYWPGTKDGVADMEPIEKDGGTNVELEDMPPVSRSWLMASRLRNGKFSEPFCMVDLGHEIDNVVSLRGTDQALDVVVCGLTDRTRGKADIYRTRVPFVRTIAAIEAFAETTYVVPGRNANFFIALRNDGNTFISGCVVEMWNEGAVVGTYQLAFNKDTLQESTYNPAQEGTDQLQGVEPDYALAPGKISLYKVTMTIPSTWLGGTDANGKRIVKTVKFRACKPTTVVGKAGSLAAQAEGAVEEGIEFSLPEPIASLNPIPVEVYHYDELAFADAPMSMVTENNNTSVTADTANAGTTNTTTPSANAPQNNVVQRSTTETTAAKKAKLANTGDSGTLGVGSAAAALAGAAILAYERRRAANESSEE